jgi:hypothetical protein
MYTAKRRLSQRCWCVCITTVCVRVCVCITVYEIIASSRWACYFFLYFYIVPRR